VSKTELHALPTSLAKFNDFQVTDFLLIHLKAQQRPHRVKTLLPCRTGIHVQEMGLQCGVGHDAQDVRMPADEQVGRVVAELLAHGRIVLGRVTADVRHPNVQFFAHKSLVFKVLFPHIRAVNIPENRPKRLESGQPGGYLKLANVARVPYFVALGEMLENAFVQETVGV
jgi:hypothetical protein